MNKGVKAVLIGSVVLNVIFAGLFIGYTLHCFLLPNDSHQKVKELLSQLPPDRRSFMETNLRKIWQDIERSHGEMTEGKKEALHLLEMEPFSEQPYLLQMQKINEIHDRMKDKMAEELATLAKQLNPQERSILAQITFYPPPDQPPIPLSKIH